MRSENNYWKVTAEQNDMEIYATAYHAVQPFSDRYVEMLEWHAQETPQEARTVLDNGCGPGFLTLKLLEMGKKVLANDVNTTYLDFLRNAVGTKNLQIFEISGEDILLKIPATSIDVVHSSLVLPFPQDNTQYLRNSYKVLGEGGKLVLTAWANVPDPYHGAVELLKEELIEKNIFERTIPYWDSLTKNSLDALTALMFERNFTEEKLTSSLERVGFKDIQKHESSYGHYCYAYTATK